MADNNLLSGIAAALGGYGGGRQSQQGNPLLGAYDAYQAGVQDDEGRRHAANMMMLATGAGILGHPAGAGGSVMSSVGQGFTQGLGVYQEITKMEQERALKDAQLQYNALKSREDAESRRVALEQTILDRQQRADEADATRRYGIQQSAATAAENRSQRAEDSAQRSADRAEGRLSSERMHADSMAVSRSNSADRIANSVAGRDAATHWQVLDDDTVMVSGKDGSDPHLLLDKQGQPVKARKTSGGEDWSAKMDEIVNGPRAGTAAPAAAASPGAGVTVGRFKIFKE